jgi:hypothetical protein
MAGALRLTLGEVYTEPTTNIYLEDESTIEKTRGMCIMISKDAPEF